MRLSASTVALMAMLLASCAETPGWHAFSFSKGERRIHGHDVEVDVDNIDLNSRPVWLATRTDRVKDELTRTSWADSETCPAMLPAFAKLRSIEPFTVVPPGVRDGASTVTLDGDSYEIHVGGYWPKADQGGDISLSSNTGPVMDWVEDTMKVLAPCWSKKRPGR